jgi:hypothetical protein
MDFIAFSEDAAAVVEAPVCVAGAAPPPWMAGEDSGGGAPPLVRLHNEILSLTGLVAPTQAEMQGRSLLVREIEGIVHALFPGGSLHVFGSQMTGVLTPSSDLDLVTIPYIYIYIYIALYIFEHDTFHVCMQVM